MKQNYINKANQKAWLSRRNLIFLVYNTIEQKYLLDLEAQLKQAGDTRFKLIVTDGVFR